MQYLSNLIWGAYPSSVVINTLGDQSANSTEPLPLSLGLPNEICKVIFSDVNFKELRNCSLVDKKWNQLTNDPMLVLKMIYEGFCFNPSHWNEFCGAGTVSDDEIAKAYASLPKDILEILKSDCPANPGYKVIDTHMLVWIPETIKGKPVTIDNFGELLKEQPEFSHHPMGYEHIYNSIVQQEGSNPIKSGWKLMTTDVIPGSRNKTMLEQLILVESLNKNGQTGYRVPKTVEAIVCIAAEYLRSKKRLFSDDPFIYTRCQGKDKYIETVVGGFAPSGLRVSSADYEDDFIGVAGLREF